MVPCSSQKWDGSTLVESESLIQNTTIESSLYVNLELLL